MGNTLFVDYSTYNFSPLFLRALQLDTDFQPEPKSKFVRYFRLSRIMIETSSGKWFIPEKTLKRLSSICTERLGAIIINPTLLPFRKCSFFDANLLQTEKNMDSLLKNHDLNDLFFVWALDSQLASQIMVDATREKENYFKNQQFEIERSLQTHRCKIIRGSCEPSAPEEGYVKCPE